MQLSYSSTRINSPRRVGAGRVLFHVLLTFFTGGLWLVVLFIRFLLTGR
jgi:hypothetical protein